MSFRMDTQVRGPETQTFIEAALQLGGATEEEARRTGSVDRADDQGDALFAKRSQTAHTPVHRALWDRDLPLDLFMPRPQALSPAAESIMQRSLETALGHR